MIGWIKLWRSSFGNALYFSEPFTKWQAWVDILLLANHDRNTTCVRGILVVVERGQVLAGEDFLADRWKWSRGKVRRFTAYLSSKTVQQIVQQKNNVCSMITVVNYERYQADGTANGTANSTTDGQQTVQQTDTLKNDKNDKNEENTPLPPQGGESLSDLDSEKPKRERKKKEPVKSIYVDSPPTYDEVADVFRSIIRDKNLKSQGNKNGAVDRVYGNTLIENYLMSRQESEWVKVTGNVVKNWNLDFRQWVNYKIKSGELVEIGSAQ